MEKLKLLIVKIGLCALLLLSGGVCPAADTSLNLSAAIGDRGSTVYDLSLQHTFSPWIVNEYFTLSPLAGLSAFMWHNRDDSLGGGVLAGGLRMDFAYLYGFRPYAAATFGPALLSGTTFDDLDLGSALQFRSQGIAGINFGSDLRHSLQASFSHYSNGGLNEHNSSYNAWGLSYGFAF
jgi:hypothetical protein